MLTRPGTLVVDLDSDDAAKIVRALACEQRLNLLRQLGNRARNISELSALLGVGASTVSLHVKILEEAGLIGSDHFSTGKASEKRCWLAFDHLVIQKRNELVPEDVNIEEIAVPIGLFTAANVVSPCGQASETENLPINLDNPASFMSPTRLSAEMVWFADGWVEYSLPLDIPARAEITKIEFEAELCSECQNFDNHWKSDISVWINGREIGTWTSPGDLGGRRGRLNPSWWNEKWTQFGILQTWAVDETGSYLGGAKCGSVTLADLHLDRSAPVVVRLGVKEDAKHRGGVNLFGKRFGDYPQDPLLRCYYRLPNKA